MTHRVAVVGAGISGLACAASLRNAGIAAVVFDKSRGPSGRMSARRHDVGSFDHGAQYFTAHDPAFVRCVDSWYSAGVVEPWSVRWGRRGPNGWGDAADTDRRWVGVPTMSAVCRHLSQTADLRLRSRAVALRRDASGWTLQLDGRGDESGFDAVVVSCPGPQAASLIPEFSEAHSVASALEYEPTWAAMLAFDRPLESRYDAIQFDGDAVLAWAARDSSKPGRPLGERWVVHATSEWSRQHLEEPAEEIRRALAGALGSHLPLGGARILHAAAHRWRYARARSSREAPWRWDPPNTIGLCGDGLSHPRVESAWLSGHGLGVELAATLR